MKEKEEIEEIEVEENIPFITLAEFIMNSSVSKFLFHTFFLR